MQLAAFLTCPPVISVRSSPSWVQRQRRGHAATALAVFGVASATRCCWQWQGLTESPIACLHAACSPINRMTPADAIVSVRETEIALAGCTEPGWVISTVENALYGDVANRCNSTLTYL